MRTRHARLLEELKRAGQLRVADVAKRYEVSTMTIRRDLEELEQQGLIVRTHGGAVPAGRVRLLGWSGPSSSTTPTKAAIGALGASLVEPGQTVMIDTGTTALEVARHLPQNIGLTIATTSLLVAQELYASSIGVLLLGGLLRREFPSLYGPVTESNLMDLHVDIGFVGCDGADSATGFYTADVHLSNLERQMVEAADKRVVVTESAKFARRAFVRYAGVEELHLLVTDPALSPEDHSRLEERGLKILYTDGE